MRVGPDKERLRDGHPRDQDEDNQKIVMDTSPMPRARYKSLVDTFADDIRSGRLAPGTRLPTHRQLAADQGLALVTASRVYAELEAMGLVSGETGRGTFVREIALPPGQGSGQMNVAAGMLDLNFNYPSLPGQADLLRTALRQLALSGELEALLKLRQAAVSQQLGRLRLEGLVKPRREGKTIYYSLTDDRCKRIISVVYDLFCR